MAAAEATLKPGCRQLQVAQVARLRQEEEESWISGEELQTEGSSDDEASIHAHAHASPTHLPLSLPSPLLAHPKVPAANPPTPSPPSTASEPAQQTDPHLTETTRRLSLMGLEKEGGAREGGQGAQIDLTPPPPPPPHQDEVEEQEEVMLWRPKRGSLKFPHVNLDPPSPATANPAAASPSPSAASTTTTTTTHLMEQVSG